MVKAFKDKEIEHVQDIMSLCYLLSPSHQGAAYLCAGTSRQEQDELHTKCANVLHRQFLYKEVILDSYAQALIRSRLGEVREEDAGGE